MINVVYKLVKRAKDGTLTSILARDKWKQTYVPGVKVTRDTPMFAFADPGDAAEFIYGNFDGIFEQYRLYECSTDVVRSIIEPIPYTDEIDQAMWEMFWRDRAAWFKTVYRQNLYARDQSFLFVNGLTLMHDMTEEYLP
jgi:hypothetical protein